MKMVFTRNPRTTGGPQRSRNVQAEGPNWIFIAGTALLSTLSFCFGYKLKEVSNAKQMDSSSQISKVTVNGKSTERKKSGSYYPSPNAFCFLQDEDGCYIHYSGSRNVVEIKHCYNGEMTEMSLPLVSVPTTDFSKENGVMQSSSPDILELPQKPFNHSNSSESPCVSESGSEIFSKREVIQKLRQQLKRRDDMTLEMQDHIAELQNFLSAQLSHSSHLQSLLDAANRDLLDSKREIQRLRKAIADHCVGHTNSLEKLPAVPVWHDKLEAEKKVKEQSTLCAHSSFIRGTQSKISEESVTKTEKLHPFIKEDVLSAIYNDVFPCTAEQYFKLLLDVDSTFTNEYRSIRKDSNLIMGQWHAADEYDGQGREITFRSVCNSPMCPPDTAMTEWQHAVLLEAEKKEKEQSALRAHSSSIRGTQSKISEESVTKTEKGLNGSAGANTRRRTLDKQGLTVVHQKPGPLQTIFNLLPDEVVEHSYSCALERSFLYHDRMHVSAWHICFHPNVFSKQMKVIIPIGDIDEIKRSQHAFINPAITTILRMCAGGHGVPPLGNPDGSRNVVEIKHRCNGDMTEMSLPLVSVPTTDFNKENGLMWSSSPDILELPQKPFNHSNSSDSPCVSESGSEIFSKREVIQKLRQELKRRDDMTLEMQDQNAELQNSLSAQLSHSSHLQSLLDAQRFRTAIADHCVGHTNSVEKLPAVPVWHDMLEAEKKEKEQSALRAHSSSIRGTQSKISEESVTETEKGLNGFAGANTQRRTLDRHGPTVVHQKPGPLQTIFNLLPYEVVEHSYSCALERSFLYHGRMYVSAWHICFHFKVLSKQMKVIIPIGDIDEIKESQHAFINPAITIILRMGAGGHGVPLGNPDGRVRYKFTSFWKRNHALRGLQLATKNYHDMLEAEKKEKEQSALLAHSSSIRGTQSKISEESVTKTEKLQPFTRRTSFLKFTTMSSHV